MESYKVGCPVIVLELAYMKSLLGFAWLHGRCGAHGSGSCFFKNMHEFCYRKHLQLVF